MKLHDGFPRVRGEECKGALTFNPVDSMSMPRGFVKILKWFGEVGNSDHEVVLDEENLVVNLARRIMRTVSPGAAPTPAPADPTIVLYDPTHPSYPSVTITDPAQIFITKMMWGTGGHVPATPSIPIDPLPTDEQLAQPISSPAYKAVTYEYPDPYQTRYTATLEQSEANGETISEVGLFTDLYTLMFARKTFGILTKSVDFAFEFRYTIVF